MKQGTGVIHIAIMDNQDKVVKHLFQDLTDPKVPRDDEDFPQFLVQVPVIGGDTWHEFQKFPYIYDSIWLK